MEIGASDRIALVELVVCLKLLDIRMEEGVDFPQMSLTRLFPFADGIRNREHRVFRVDQFPLLKRESQFVNQMVQRRSKVVDTVAEEQAGSGEHERKFRRHVTNVQ